MKKNSFIIVSLILIITIAGMFSCSQNNGKPVAIKNNTQVEHGKYLVTLMGCNDCHTPLKMGLQGPEPDMERFLSGHPSAFRLPSVDTNALKNWVLFAQTNTAIAGPWGISFTANLTSDSTGIGTWSLEQFKKALKEGKFMGLDGARQLLPPMPWQNYKNIKDEDIADIFAFLKSTKPIHNVVPAAVLMNAPH